MSSAAVEGPYRYHLRRGIGPGRSSCAWVMLNPSIADAVRDDPTIRKVVGFTKRWGFDVAEVVNLFAWRSTDPRSLVRNDGADVVGPRNDQEIRETCERVDRVVLAWGSVAHPLSRARAIVVADEVFRVARGDIVALNTTKSGGFMHPLYAPYDRTPMQLRGAR